MAEHRELSPSQRKKSEGLGKRLKDTPRWVWIALLIAGATLVITYLIYQRNQQQGTVADTQGAPQGGPTDGATVPGSTTSGGGTSGVDLSGLQASITEENNLLQQILSYFQQQGGLPPMPTPSVPAGGIGGGGILPGGQGGGGIGGGGILPGGQGGGVVSGGIGGGGILPGLQQFLTNLGAGPAPPNPFEGATGPTSPPGIPGQLFNPLTYSPGQDGTTGTPAPPIQPPPQRGTIAGGALPPPIRPGNRGGGALPPPVRPGRRPGYHQ